MTLIMADTRGCAIGKAGMEPKATVRGDCTALGELLLASVEFDMACPVPLAVVAPSEWHLVAWTSLPLSPAGKPRLLLIILPQGRASGGIGYSLETTAGSLDVVCDTRSAGEMMRSFDPVALIRTLLSSADALSRQAISTSLDALRPALDETLRLAPELSFEWRPGEGVLSLDGRATFPDHVLFDDGTAFELCSVRKVSIAAGLTEVPIAIELGGRDAGAPRALVGNGWLFCLRTRLRGSRTD